MINLQAYHRSPYLCHRNRIYESLEKTISIESRISRHKLTCCNKHSMDALISVHILNQNPLGRILICGHRWTDNFLQHSLALKHKHTRLYRPAEKEKIT